MLNIDNPSGCLSVMRRKRKAPTPTPTTRSYRTAIGAVLLCMLAASLSAQYLVLAHG